MNLGIQKASAPILFTLNADSELLPNTLPPILNALSRFPRAGILGPAQYAPERGVYWACAFSDPTLARETWRLLFFADRISAWLHLGPWQKLRDGLPRPVDWIIGAALVFRRECLDSIKGFDETQFMYGEDWDVCYRARKQGWQVYFVPEAKIIHHQNVSAAKQFGADRAARVLEANLYFHEKHFGRTSRRLLALLHLLGGCLRLAPLLLFRLVQRSSARTRWHAQMGQARAALRGLG